MRAAPLAIATLAALAACSTNDDRLTPRFQGPAAPDGVVTPTKAADPLIVGHRLMDAGEYELALKSYYRAAGELGATAPVLSALGSANLRLGRLGQAERLLRQAIDRAPEDPRAWNNLGVVLMERRQPAEAKEVFRRAYALDSGETDAIRENLRLAIARTEFAAYGSDIEKDNELVRDGSGSYRLLTH
ncbi:hypothetical protein BV394_06325 [Brevirhabdus pacifica]|uniref:Uncharacterized protein n=1 Tax=Brevirhabdus pacifica TaxID=1267768 RepID=A0A1U7DHM5_9RHOB|nr:tetratricopeptide repeat protein [Brevirhabdus pacifica]APX89378.1 hypothetical protein BV394_06325 [Brevirhabdus pacifica]OWU76597.1 hypothetical protein ATO5_09965 [Loktanella sp. 22II-4b]PJJ85988.1 tetratricopeptide repeat protein [Brevirhabdus pacifica]